MTTVFKSREIYSGSDSLEALGVENLHFKTFCRMSSSDFEALINLVGPKIAKADSTFRKAIPVVKRLALTLRYLATGDSYSSLSFVFKVSKQVISNILPEVCAALLDSLKEFVKIPQTQDEWLLVAEEYERKWNFPHCVGAMDGKLCAVQCPANSGSDFFNYKSFFSIVIFGLVDADYCFMYADVGCHGRIPDSSVFRNTTFFKNMENGIVIFPDAHALPGRQKGVPYVIVADDAFPLNNHIMKPYSGQQHGGSSKHIFNYRLSRARQIVENAFGILSSVFRVLRKPILLQPEKAQSVIMACIYLHNFLRKSCDSRQIYTPGGALDHEENGHVTRGTWRNEITTATTFTPLPTISRQSTQTANDIRDEFAAYFMSEDGRVPWQVDYQ
ncbi:hypothetical protein B7P43_G03830 [Cryptotermes secundus]|uniref:DDE Tnp4 domain-containing protein n=2 Tax=Cryptotermes secundus TaxID=105785 RepID=A0A2J7QAN9_9NEOP|nr:hypothetical protein B7P43_G03830 [Cryptotermes secundus]